MKRLFGGIYVLLLLSAVVAFTIKSLSLGAQTTNPPTTPSNASLSPSLREFEVATIKPSNMNGTGLMGLYVYPGGRVLCGYCPVESLVELAFDMQSYQIEGLPGWAKDIAYDVNAKIPESTSPSNNADMSSHSPPNGDQREMLQTLLRDRFHLKFHRQSVLGPVFVLTKGHGQLKLYPPKDTSKPPWAGSNIGAAIDGDGIAGKNISMPMLAVRLSRYLRRPVVDQTGLKGNFDFQFDIANDQPVDDVVPSIVTSMQGIGLMLKTGRAPVETIIIDHVDRPSEN
jgi:uncharacterized protein (TIGR03435 family)